MASDCSDGKMIGYTSSNELTQWNFIDSFNSSFSISTSAKLSIGTITSWIFYFLATIIFYLIPNVFNTLPFNVSQPVSATPGLTFLLSAIIRSILYLMKPMHKQLLENLWNHPFQRHLKEHGYELRSRINIHYVLNFLRSFQHKCKKYSQPT